MPKEIKEEEFVKVCPKCASENVATDFSNPVVWDTGANPKSQCRSCGHLGVIFPEVEKKDIKSFKSELNKNEAKNEFKKDPIIDAKTGFNVGIIELASAAIIAVTVIILFFVFR